MSIRLRWSYSLLALLVVAQLGAAVFGLLRAGGYLGSRPLASTFPVPVSEPAPGETPGKQVEVPVHLDIPALGVSAPIDPMGLNGDRTMQVPEDFSRTGWYTGLESPGMNGTAVIVGHFDSRTGPAVFYKLKDLAPGDEIAVTMASGRIEKFVVEREAQYPKDQFPTIAVYSPTSNPTLRLITCDGVFDRQTRHYEDNYVVFANSTLQA